MNTLKKIEEFIFESKIWKLIIVIALLTFSKQESAEYPTWTLR